MVQSLVKKETVVSSIKMPTNARDSARDAASSVADAVVERVDKSTHRSNAVVAQEIIEKDSVVSSLLDLALVPRTVVIDKSTKKPLKKEDRHYLTQLEKLIEHPIKVDSDVSSLQVEIVDINEV